MFIVTPLLERWLIKASEAPSPLEVRVTLLVTNTYFLVLGINKLQLIEDLNGELH